jgi:hypothetical protein
MLAVQALEWREAEEQQDHVAQRRIAETASFFLVSYCGSMRVFELPKALLTNLRHGLHTKTGPHGHPPHAGVFFLGRFKARSNAEKKILVFLMAVTESGLRPALWLDRLIKILENLGILSGWLFQASQGKQSSTSSFAKDFYCILFVICEEEPTLFEPTMYIMEDYHLARSLWHGATT